VRIIALLLAKITGNLEPYVTQHSTSCRRHGNGGRCELRRRNNDSHPCHPGPGRLQNVQSTSVAYGNDGKLAVLYREETGNDRDIYLALWDRTNAALTHTRVSTTGWHVNACPMTYFTVRANATGYVAAWPTRGEVYFARLSKDGTVLPPGEIKTPGTSGMRSGVLALSANDGATLVAWKNKETLGWQLYDAKGQAEGEPGSTKSAGTGAAGALLPNEKFVLFPLAEGTLD